MSTVIKGFGLSQPDNTKGYLEHAIAAANACLAQVECPRDEIDLLINAGIYRDNNTCEPSVAALIQHGLGIHLNPITTPVRKHTFSFDVLNGACGLLNALQIAHSILETKQQTRALLIAGESHPSMQPDDNFPLEHSAVALLVERSEQGGFTTFQFQSTPQFQGRKGYLDLAVHQTASRHSLAFEETTETTTLPTFIETVVESYLSKHNINPDETALLLAHPASTLSDNLAQSLGMSLAVGTFDWQTLGDLNSAGLGFGLAATIPSATKDTLCVVLGTGATVGCALYRQSN